ncbi:MAG: GyrI-like domain-containing protein [Bacteroidota bacterium]
MNKLLSFVALVAFLIVMGIQADSTASLNTKSNFMIQDTLIPAKVQLEKTNFKDMSVLFITDTAATTETIKDILGKGYRELLQFIQQNKLQPLKFMGWYYSTQPPWPVDIAVETVNMPEQLSGRIRSRILKGGEVLIAHVWGSYDEVGQGYAKIQTWLKENKRKAKGSPFEVYINDPSVVKDPSEIQTDIYQPLE